MNAINEISSHYKRYFHSLFYPHQNIHGNTLTLNEAILLSWPFVIVGVITNTVFTIYITVNFFQTNTFKSFPFLSSGSLLTFPLLIGLFWSLWGILLFPIRAYIYAYFLNLVIGFYQRITKTYSQDSSLAMDLAAAAMSSNVFRIFPGFGDMLQSLAQFLCLFKGLKERMGINSFAAFCILVTPMLLTFMFIAGMLYSLFLLIFV